MYVWVYSSPIGQMKIIRNDSGRYSLFIDDAFYGSYHSAEKAADDVYLHETGFDSWDSLDGSIPDAPANLSEWEWL